MKDLYSEYLKEIFKNLPNNYHDNWDHYRFGSNEPKPQGFITKIKARGRQWLNENKYYNLTDLVNYSDNLHHFEYLYDNLKQPSDKGLLLQVLAYRTLGHTKVKLPLNTTEYWETIRRLADLNDQTDAINPNFMHFKLCKINLQKIGYPIQLYFLENGVMVDFVIKQYEYNKNDVVIKAEKGDVVIDAGGCWGDTALFFANEVGASGKVYSFEFIPKNIEIFEKNVSLNPSLQETIKLIRQPLWSDSSTNIFFEDFGPGSRVSLDSSQGFVEQCSTLSIDDFVLQNDLQKVNFIKMDIEGAETNALIGAAQTIKKFKPKLAISLYHSVEDFERIPKLIHQIAPEYKFYFSHCTIHSEESVLFANPT